MKAKPKSYYMHTLNGQAAYWDAKQQLILFMDNKDNSVLTNSLAQIRHEQKLDCDDGSARGYLRVCLPVEGKTP